MEKPSVPIALSRSVVLTEQSSIPSLLLLGKLVSDCSPPDSAASLPDKLRQIWDPSGTVNFWRVTEGAFLVQFYEAKDLMKAHDGAPWPCGGDGHDLFLVEHVKPGTNMVDQIARLTKANLWVRFHGVPVDHFSTSSVCALAAAVGETVSCDLSHTSSPEFLRARVRVDITRPLKRSVDITLENDEQATSVSVEYEGAPGLCCSCGVLGHPADRCHCRANLQTAAVAAAVAPSRQENPAVYTPSHLRPRRSTSGSSSSSHRGKSSRRHEVVFAPAPPAPPGRKSEQERLSPVNGSCFSFLNITRLRTWRKGPSLGRNKSSSAGDDSQDELLVPAASNRENSAHERLVQEPSIVEAQETQLDTTTIRHSHFIVKAHGSRSRKHARIEVVVETHCPPQLIMGAMQWLSKKGKHTGLDAAYDGNRGIISIFGLKIDQNTDPVDLIAYLLPKMRPKSGLAETQTRPDSPARFADTMMRFHDANCCREASKESVKNGI